MKQKRAYQYRCYPTAEQERILARTFGCARFVYNWALQLRMDAYSKEHRIGYYETSTQLTALKQRPAYQWLKEVASVPLQQALRHLERAFRNFFEGRAAYPKFHKRHGEQAATYVGTAFHWHGQTLTLAKMDMPLHIIWSRPLPDGAKPSTVTITKDTAGRYFVSILVEEETNPLPVVNKQVGLDLGLKSMVITSSGETIGNPKYAAFDEKKLAKAQRRLAKKQKGSKNRAKARIKVARIHAKLLIGDGTISTNSRLASFVKTKRSASRACKSRTWSRTTPLPEPSATSDGVTLCPNWNTKHSGMGVPWSRLTNGTHPPNAVLCAGIY